MIKQIKTEIVKNQKCFGIKSFEESDVFVSKFFHGNPATNNKIIFYISVFSSPLCILKIPRTSEFNSIVEREDKGMLFFKESGLLVPKVFFKGEILGNKYICEELVNASPVGKYNEIGTFPLVAKYHKSLRKGEEIQLQNIIDKVLELSIQNDQELEDVLGLLSEYKSGSIYVSNQHGDLTCRNIFIRNDNLVFIDLENFGLRSFWGGDVIHYLVRIFDTSSSIDISQRARLFVEKTKEFRDTYDLGISDKDSEILYLVDFLFEILQKNHPEIYNKTTNLMSNLWSE